MYFKRKHSPAAAAGAARGPRLFEERRNVALGHGCRRRDALRGALPAAGSLCPWERSSVDREGGNRRGGEGGRRLHEACAFFSFPVCPPLLRSECLRGADI